VDIPSIVFLDLILSLIVTLCSAIIGAFLRLLESLVIKKKPEYYKFIILYTLWTQVPIISNYVGSALSCETVLEQKILRNDGLETCFGSDHVQYLFKLIIPVSLFLTLLGTYAFYYLKKMRQKLNHIRINLVYGMLYSEFKSNYCYYEVFKLSVKLTLVLFINNVSDNHLLVLAILIILSSYYLLTKVIHPYIYWKTQAIDEN
jgi:hypothetical protein